MAYGGIIMEYGVIFCIYGVGNIFECCWYYCISILPINCLMKMLHYTFRTSPLRQAEAAMKLIKRTGEEIRTGNFRAALNVGQKATGLHIVYPLCWMIKNKNQNWTYWIKDIMLSYSYYWTVFCQVKTFHLTVSADKWCRSQSLTRPPGICLHPFYRYKDFWETFTNSMWYMIFNILSVLKAPIRVTIIPYLSRKKPSKPQRSNLSRCFTAVQLVDGRVSRSYMAFFFAY